MEIQDANSGKMDLNRESDKLTSPKHKFKNYTMFWICAIISAASYFLYDPPINYVFCIIIATPLLLLIHSKLTHKSQKKSITQ